MQKGYETNMHPTNDIVNGRKIANMTYSEKVSKKVMDRYC